MNCLSNPSLETSYQPSVSAADLFDRRVSFEKEAESSYARNTGNGKCILCGKEMEIEAMPDMYEHLFEHHIKNFIKCMVLSHHIVDHIIEDDIRYVKEEVKAVASITNCMGFRTGVYSLAELCTWLNKKPGI